MTPDEQEDITIDLVQLQLPIVIAVAVCEPDGVPVQYEEETD